MLRDFAPFVIFLIFVLFLNPIIPLYYGGTRTLIGWAKKAALRLHWVLVSRWTEATEAGNGDGKKEIFRSFRLHFHRAYAYFYVVSENQALCRNEDSRDVSISTSTRLSKSFVLFMLMFMVMSLMSPVRKALT